MRRKLIKQGAGGLTVVLPKEWVSQAGLQAGEEVEVIEDDGALRISPPAAVGNGAVLKRGILHIADARFTFYRSVLGGFYRAGYSEIAVTFESQKALLELQKAIEMLPGYEMYELKERSCVIRCVAQMARSELDLHVLKMRHVIGTMFSLMLDELSGKEKTSLEMIFSLRNSVLKERDVVLRLVSQYRLLSEKSFPNVTIVTQLWTVARSLYYMYERISCKKLKIGSDERRLLFETYELFKVMFTSHDEHVRRKRYDAVREELEIAGRTGKGGAAMYLFPIAMALESCNSALVMIQLGESSKP